MLLILLLFLMIPLCTTSGVSSSLWYQIIKQNGCFQDRDSYTSLTQVVSPWWPTDSGINPVCWVILSLLSNQYQTKWQLSKPYFLNLTHSLIHSLQCQTIIKQNGGFQELTSCTSLIVSSTDSGVKPLCAKVFFKAAAPDLYASIVWKCKMIFK